MLKVTNSLAMCVLGYGGHICDCLLCIPIVDCVHIQLNCGLMNQNGNNEILSVETPARDGNYSFRNLLSCVHLKSQIAS
jgi:hypothetical protein